jgi:hypothetical protein
MAHMRTCLFGSISSNRFDIEPPTLEYAYMEVCMEVSMEANPLHDEQPHLIGCKRMRSRTQPLFVQCPLLILLLYLRRFEVTIISKPYQKSAMSKVAVGTPPTCFVICVCCATSCSCACFPSLSICAICKRDWASCAWS